MKNIPIPGKWEYKKKLVSATEKFARNISWRAHHYIKRHPDKFGIRKDLHQDDQEERKTYGFKSEAKPPKVEQIQPFLEDVYALVKNVEFGFINDKFMEELKEDNESYKATDKVIMFADKSRNLYSIPRDRYEKTFLSSF